MLGKAYLCGESMRDAWYAVGVLTFAFALAMFADGARFFRRRKRLAALGSDPAHAAANLPEAADAPEADAFALIRGLDGECSALRQSAERDQREREEYYTLWVHQIKTPIAGMRLVLDGMRGREADVLRRELFSVEQYADMALRYVKLGDIAGDLVPERCAVEPMVRAAVKAYALPFVYKRLSVRILPMERSVVTDRRWFGFVLEQILSNAVKYTERGGVTISLDEDALTIADTGIGVRPEDLPRVFEKGFTGYNGRLDARASGIGLYLVKRAADALGIRVSMRSTPGEGTAVTLLLPGERETWE